MRLFFHIGSLYDAEAVLFVYDRESEASEFHRVLYQRVSPDKDVY